MNRLYITILLLSTTLFGMEIPTAHVEMHKFGKSIELNSKIIQLSNAKQSVTSLVSGHLENYFVKAGEVVKSGQKLALIESILVSKMTADYLSLKKQYISLNKNYVANKKLYDSGMLSMQKLNDISIKRSAMNSKIVALHSQLKTLGINADKLKKATANFILYAHSSGRVAKLHLSLHTVVRVDEVLISIVKEQAFYAKSYLPLEYANSVKVGQKLVLNYNNEEIVTHVRQVLPEVDTTTQRIVVLSSIDERVEGLFINAYVGSKLYFQAKKSLLGVKTTALSFYNNEWVVFVPKKEEHETEEGHGEHEEHGGGEEGEEHEEHEAPYSAKVVEIVAQDEEFTAVNGLELGEEYVSAKSYYAKSMLLKSSLGEHGH